MPGPGWPNRSLQFAAPDLLAACKALDEFQRHYQENTCDNAPGNSFYAEKLMAVVNMARDAIARAEGRQ